MPFLENIATDVFVKPTAAHPFNYWPMVLTVCLSATVCLAEDPSFPQAAEAVEYLKNQYIVQFEDADGFELAKRSILKENEEVNLVRNIDSRNIAVYKFSDKKAAAKWRESTAGIKYFEAGENTIMLWLCLLPLGRFPLEYYLRHGSK
jgi:hypothetical protein